MFHSCDKGTYKNIPLAGVISGTTEKRIGTVGFSVVSGLVPGENKFI